MRVFDVQHQLRAHRGIQRALASGRMPHGTVFHGPAGVGKEMMAVRLARLLLCGSTGPVPTGDVPAGYGDEEAWQDACGRCRDCELVGMGTHPDLHVVTRQLHRNHPDPAIRQRKGLDLSVEVIRRFLIEPAHVHATAGRAKVFVVVEAERMTTSAQNALLKTLEEPPPGTFLVLLVDRTDRLLPTIASRTQPLAFGPLPTDFVRQVVQARSGLGDDQAAFVATQSGGRLGLALAYAEDGLVEIKQQLLSGWANGRDASPSQRAKSLAGLASTLAQRQRDRDPELSQADADRLGLRTLLAVLAGAYRDALLHVHQCDTPIINADQPDVVASIGAQWGVRAGEVIDLLVRTEEQIEQNVNTTLALESLVVRSGALRQPADPARAGSRGLP